MNKYILGLMSGTSADGLTVSAVIPQPFQIVCFQNYPYPKQLQQKLLTAYQLTAPALSELHYEIGALYAKTVQRFLKKHHVTPAQIAAVGMHGQTVYHGPHDKTPNTLQLGEPSFLAASLGCPVVSDLRAMDIVQGGEGAPLMPFFDEYIFGQKSPKMLVNIGGISNISVVGKHIKTFGFDCGPGNTLLDLACQQYFHKPFDTNGSLAARGTPDTKLVARLLKQPFFRQKPPKSLDKNTFGRAYLARYFTLKNPYDLLATLTYFTAACVAKSVTDFVPARARGEMVLSGGGCYNQTLVRYLDGLLPDTWLTTSAGYGIDPHAKESAAFALFAWLNLQRKINHCARATGARKNVILGKVTV